MKFEQVRFHEFGGPDVLVLEAGEVPSPGKGQVLIFVAGAGVNPIDFKTRSGLGFVASQIGEALPWTPGYDISGTVVALGEGVREWHVGDQVVGMPGFPLEGGGYATHIVADAHRVVRAPERMDLADAGAVPLAALTAWQALFDAGHLEAEQKVLIHAAAGGVGHFAVQFAKTVDAQVIATASATNHEFLRDLGADEVIDYHQVDFRDACYGLDLIIDGVGGQVGLNSIPLLSERGRLVTIPTVTAQQIVGEAKAAGVSALGMTVEFDPVQLENIVELIDTDDVRCEIQQTFRLREAAQAHRLLEQGHVRGKLLIIP